MVIASLRRKSARFDSGTLVILSFSPSGRFSSTTWDTDKAAAAPTLVTCELFPTLETKVREGKDSQGLCSLQCP